MEKQSKELTQKQLSRRELLRYETKSFMNEFVGFIVQGNALDLAIGFILGAGFTGVVQSFVKNIVLPPVGKILGNVDFSSLYFSLSTHQYASLSDAEAAGAPIIKYGLFLNDLINFIILALVVFIALRLLFRKYLEQKLKKGDLTKSEKKEIKKELSK